MEFFQSIVSFGDLELELSIEDWHILRGMMTHLIMLFFIRTTLHELVFAQYLLEQEFTYEYDKSIRSLRWTFERTLMVLRNLELRN